MRINLLYHYIVMNEQYKEMLRTKKEIEKLDLKIISIKLDLQTQKETRDYLLRKYYKLLKY
tara:strand:+ start:311 stop:493 length:183 start_codon:yes stop_codon:yes gene_type:complete